MFNPYESEWSWGNGIEGIFHIIKAPEQEPNYQMFLSS